MCDFNLHEPTGWTAAVSAFEQIRSDDGRTVTLRGECPRCSHEMSVELAIDERTGERISSNQDNETLGDRSFVKVAFCNCVSSHEERPDEREGCGAFGALRIG